MTTAALKPDEVQCQWCECIFISPEAYEAHNPKPKKCWHNSHVLEINEKTHRWQFRGKDPSQKPRKTQAMAAFDRILKGLSSAEQQRSIGTPKHYSLDDVVKVQKALEKARDS